MQRARNVIFRRAARRCILNVRALSDAAAAAAAVAAATAERRDRRFAAIPPSTRRRNSAKHQRSLLIYRVTRATHGAGRKEATRQLSKGETVRMKLRNLLIEFSTRNF